MSKSGGGKGNAGQVSVGLTLKGEEFSAQLNKEVDKGIKKATKNSETGTKQGFSMLGTTAAVTFAAAFAAKAGKALVSFAKESISLGSDLAEVQNVVDTVFKDSTGSINEFAKAAIKAYGLSETSAKQYASTSGALLKSMGIGNMETLTQMSTTIAGLAGDMASFYNLDSADAFAKLRSGLAGETEPLKQLGINLSVANLEAFALSRGITESYQSMSEANKAILRYNYILSQTQDAQGDFVRTQSGWANQTRILSENLNALKANLGQGFIALLTPILQVLNVFIERLTVAAEKFRDFVYSITGVEKEENNKMGSSVDTLATSANTATSSIKKTTAAVKKLKGSVMGWDELNKLNSKDENSGTGADGISSNLSLNPDKLNSQLKTTNKEISKTGKIINGLVRFIEIYIETIYKIFEPWGKLLSKTKGFSVVLEKIAGNEKFIEIFAKATAVITMMLNPLGQTAILIYVVDKALNVLRIAWDKLKEAVIKADIAVKAFFSGLADKLKEEWQVFVESMKTGWDNLKIKCSETWENLKVGFKTAMDSMKTTATETFNRITTILKGSFKNTFTNVLTSIKNTVKSIINSIISMINTCIEGLNKIDFQAPDFLGGKEYKVNIAKIPMLAEGGYLKANTPQLFIGGDNKTEGEIVAPESKIAEAVSVGVAQAMQMFMSMGGGVSMAGAGAGYSGDIIIPVQIGDEKVETIMVNAQNKKNLRGGR